MTSYKSQKHNVSADAISNYFHSKVSTIKDSTAGLPPPINKISHSVVFDVFKDCSTDELRTVIHFAPGKSCSLDPIPHSLLCEILEDLLFFLRLLVNTLLHERYLPTSQKHATITPIVKKEGMDPDVSFRYRPISNFRFYQR